MKKLASTLICIFLPLMALSAQTLILTGAPPPSIVHIRNGNMWVSGTIILHYDATSSTSTTTDISPASNDTSTSGRDYWTKSGTTTKTQITSTQIYKTQSTSGYVVKKWGSESLTSSNVYPFTFTSAVHETTFTYWLYYKYNSSWSTGTYELPILIRSWKKAFSGSSPGTPDATMPITLSIVVNPSAEISIVGPGDPFDALQFSKTLSFPDLLSTTPAGFRVYVSSNYRYALSVRSTNGGVLKHGSYADETLGYTLSVGGVPIALLANTDVPIAPNEIYNMASTPKLYQSLVTPAVPDNLAAGNYSDTLTFSITTP